MSDKGVLRTIARLDPPFWLGDPNLHDGQLLSLTLTEHGLDIGCQDIGGSKHVLRLTELVTMCADDFRQGTLSVMSLFMSALIARDRVWLARVGSARVNLETGSATSPAR